MSHGAFPNNLVIRSAIPISKEEGYILAVDPKKADREIPHTVVFHWTPSSMTRQDLTFDAMQGCVARSPAGMALVLIAWSGQYLIRTPVGDVEGNIYDAEPDDSEDPRYGSFTAISEIDGAIFAVGLRGTVFELEGLSRWVSRDGGLPKTFNAQAVHGHHAAGVYVAGRKGEIWHFDRQRWTQQPTPTNLNLSCLCCAADGRVFAAGRRGTAVTGLDHTWASIEHEEPSEDFWGISCFDGGLHVSSLVTVYRWTGKGFETVDFGSDTPRTTNTLRTGRDVLWSVGSEDIMAFNGANWFRVI